MCLRQSHSQFLGVAMRAGTTVGIQRCHGQGITSNEPRVPGCACGYDISHGVAACAQDFNRRARGGRRSRCRRSGSTEMPLPSVPAARPKHRSRAYEPLRYRFSHLRRRRVNLRCSAPPGLDSTALNDLANAHTPMMQHKPI